MGRRFALLVLAVGLCISPIAHAANIIFVTESGDTDADGVQDDLGLEEFLVGLGHQVDVRRGNWTTLDAAKIAELNAADLVVVSRRTGSGNYATDATEIGQWNGLTSPMLLLTPYLSRGTTSNFRWYWLNSSTINNLTGPLMQVLVPGHPIFNGVELDESGQVDVVDGTTGTGQTSFAGTVDVGSGTLLSQTAGGANAWIVEWQAGTPYYQGSPGTPGSHRMLFSLGTQESGATPQGAFNATENGKLILANAISYLLGELDVTLAATPSPADKATDVLRDLILSWTSGRFAQTHNVYLGVSQADVEQASADNPLGVLVSEGQSDSSFDPGRLELGRTYYWRVDEVNAAPDNAVFKGRVWSFSVEPASYPITGVTATASSATKDMGPDKTIDGSGLDEADRHSTSSTDMWLSAKGAEQPTWIQYEFSRVYPLDKMQVWNSNQALESILGVGAKDVTVEYSVDGENWTALGDAEFARASGLTDYSSDISVDFAGAPAKFVKLTITSNWGGLLAQYGLSEVRFYYVPVMAREPQPADAAVDVNPQVNFAWRAGREAASHKVYVSADQQAVIDGTVAPAAVSTPEYETSLMFDTTYYWKVVEVNEAEAVPAWDSAVWSFSTGSFIAVDDFESYTDKDGVRIYQSWIDGYEDDTNGSLVGYGEAPFAEQTVIHGGKQSMPLAYDNSGSATTSEAKLTFESPQDWTRHGITTLVVFFRGQSANSGSSLYLKVNDTKVAFNNGAAATTYPVWKQWNIALGSISGLKSVKSLTIGVEGAGAGTLFVDDIRLYAAAPEVVAPADPGTTGLIGWYKMEDNVQDSSGKNYNGTLTAGAGYDVGVDGKALAFNGTSTYVDLPLGPAINTMTDMTIATSVNFSGGTGSWQRISDFGTGSTNYMFLSPRQSTAGSMRFAIRTAAVGEQIVDSSAVLPTNGWHHVAISIDSATMTMTLYLDGDPVGQAATTLLPKDLGNTNQNWLGRSQYTADAYFSGLLDEFRIYNRTLSAGEVRYLAGDR